MLVPRRSPDEAPRVYAHRGANRSAPENTLRAFDQALAAGADGVELDVRLCRTGEIVVHHDPTLDRSAGDERTLADLSWDELRRIRTGDEPIPLLSEVLDRVLPAGRLVNVEIKGDVPNRVRTWDAVRAQLTALPHRYRRQIVISSFRPELAIGYGDIASCLLYDFEHTGPRRAALLRRVLPTSGFHPSDSATDEALVRRVRARGQMINVWTVNTPERARELARWGVDGLITDDVPAIRAALA